MKKLTVLSLFDGISYGKMALESAGFDIGTYFASEIDKKAITMSDANFERIIRLGDVLCVFGKNLPKVDLLLGGPPCQDLSRAGKRKGLSGERSGLFYEYARILNETKPTVFLMENVKMDAEVQSTISESLFGIEPYEVDSASFSPQRRKRLYWMGVSDGKGGYFRPEIEIPKIANNETLRDILEKGTFEALPEKLLKTYRLLSPGQHWKHLPDGNEEKERILESGRKHANPGGRTGFFKLYDIDAKSPTITAQGTFQKMTRFVFQDANGTVRYPTARECARLQTIPDSFDLDSVNGKDAIKAIGNGWNVKTISFLLDSVKDYL